MTATELLAGVWAALAVLLAAGAPPRRPVRPASASAARAPARASGAAPVPAPVQLDLVAEVLAGGAPVTRAVAAVGEALRAAGDPRATELLELAARLATGVRGASPPAAGAVAARLAESLDLALSTGSSPVGLIRAAAQEERRAAAARGVQAARRLGVLVLLPTGLCLLPAFLLLTVVPVAIGLALG